MSMQLALPAQGLEERPDRFAALALVADGGGARLIERRFGPDLEHAIHYVVEQDLDDLAPDVPATAVIRVAAATAGSIGWLAWRDVNGLAATPRLALREHMLLALPAGPSFVTAGYETQEHDLVAYVLQPETEYTLVYACRFGSPVEVVEPPDPADPEDWDDTFLVPGASERELVCRFKGRPVGEAAIAQVPDSREVRLVVPMVLRSAYCIAHFTVVDRRAELTSVASYPDVRPVAGGALSIYVADDGASTVAGVGVREIRDPARESGGDTVYEPVLLTTRFQGASVQQDSFPCGTQLSAPPRAAIAAFSSMVNERPLCRVALIEADGQVLLSGRDGALKPVHVGAPAIEPMVLLVFEEATYLGVAADSGPALATVSES